LETTNRFLSHNKDQKIIIAFLNYYIFLTEEKYFLVYDETE
jgi:hypothetical protein